MITMIQQIIHEKDFALYFGDHSTAYIKNSLHGYEQDAIKQLPGYKEFCQEQQCNSIIILNQVHGNKGYSAHEERDIHLQPYSYDGDYIVTTRAGVALAVETADCVPLVLIDRNKPCIALVHAGWRGSVQGVVHQAVADMLESGSAIGDITVYYGPSARACCYEVSEDFKEHFDISDTHTGSFFQRRNRKLYFDNVTFITHELKKMGIVPENIQTSYAVCTVCSERYCSYRRESNVNLRQMTIVALK